MCSFVARQPPLAQPHGCHRCRTAWRRLRLQPPHAPRACLLTCLILPLLAQNDASSICVAPRCGVPCMRAIGCSEPCAGAQSCPRACGRNATAPELNDGNRLAHLVHILHGEGVQRRSGGQRDRALQGAPQPCSAQYQLAQQGELPVQAWWPGATLHVTSGMWHCSI